MSEHLPETVLWAYLDGDLEDGDREARAAAAAHLGECRPCRDELDVLRGLAERLAAQPDLPPPRDLWPALSARIRTPIPTSTRAPAADPLSAAPGRRRRAWPASLAAGLLAALGLAGVWWLDRDAANRDTPPSRAAGATVQDTAADLLRATAADLEAHLAALPRDDGWTPIFEHGLAEIDRTLRETAAALERAPNDPDLQHHLLIMLRSRVRYLQRAGEALSSFSS